MEFPDDQASVAARRSSAIVVGVLTISGIVFIVAGIALGFVIEPIIGFLLALFGLTDLCVAAFLRRRLEVAGGGRSENPYARED